VARRWIVLWRCPAVCRRTAASCSAALPTRPGQMAAWGSNWRHTVIPGSVS